MYFDVVLIVIICFCLFCFCFCFVFLFFFVCFFVCFFVVFLWSFGNIYSSCVEKQTTAYADAGGARDVTVSSVSHKQTQSNRVCGFFNNIVSLYLETTTTVVLPCHGCSK